MAKYSQVSAPIDIVRINRMLQKEAKESKTKDHLARLRQKSQYLYALTFSPSWETHTHGHVMKMRNAAESQYTETARIINKRMKQLGYSMKFDTKIG